MNQEEKLAEVEAEKIREAVDANALAELKKLSMKDHAGAFATPVMCKGITPPRELGAVPPIPAPPEPAIPSAAQEKSDGQIKLDRATVLEIDNYSLQCRVVDLEEEKAREALKQIAAKRQALKTLERQLMMKISAQAGRPVTGRVRLMDKENGICVIE